MPVDENGFEIVTDDNGFEIVQPGKDPNNWKTSGWMTQYTGPGSETNLENRPDQVIFGGYEKPIADYQSRLAKYVKGKPWESIVNTVAGLQAGTANFLLGSLAQPDVIGTMGAGALRPKVSEFPLKQPADVIPPTLDIKIPGKTGPVLSPKEPDLISLFDKNNELAKNNQQLRDFLDGVTPTPGKTQRMLSPESGQNIDINAPVTKVIDETISKPKPKYRFDPSTKTYTSETGEVFDSTGKLVSPKVSPPMPTLPLDLAGVEPSIIVNGKTYTPRFESDLDKAMFIVGQGRPNVNNPAYVKFLMEQTGLPVNEARKLGQVYKGHTVEFLKGKEPGEVQIPAMWKAEELPGFKAEATKTPFTEQVIPKTQAEVVNETINKPTIVGPQNVRQVIQSIPKTGNIEFDNLVSKLQAIRNKARTGLTDEELLNYQNIAEQVRNHPAMPPEVEAQWKAIGDKTLAEGPKFKVGDEVKVRTPSKATSKPTEVPKLDKFEIAKRNLDERQARGEVVDYEDELENLESLYGVIRTQSNETNKILDEIMAANKAGNVVYPPGYKGKPPNPSTIVGKLSDGSIVAKQGSITSEVPKSEKLGTVGPPPSKPPIDTIPSEGPVPEHIGRLVDKKQRAIIEAFNLPRALMTSIDLSAPLRQGKALMYRKQYWQAFDDMFKSLGSEKAFRAVENSIAEHPLFKTTFENGKRIKSFAEEAGLKLTDLTNLSSREEQLMSTWAEKIPGVRASNRAYTAFLNKLRSDVFIDMVEKNGLKNDPLLAKKFANYINNATGRGSLGRFEKDAVELNTAFFAPRNTISQIKHLNTILNPASYIYAPPALRKEAIKSLLTMAGTTSSILYLGKMAGAQVSTDPDNADFGKMKIGKTRLDFNGGYGQNLVAAVRLLKTLGESKPTFTSSKTGKEVRTSPTEIIGQFARNKEHPVVSFVHSWLSGRLPNGQKFNPPQQVIQLFTPMMMRDVYEVFKENPTLAAGVAIPATFGMGLQTY